MNTPEHHDVETPDSDPAAAAEGGMPTWVKGSLVVCTLVALMFVALMLTGADQGPSRHS